MGLFAVGKTEQYPFLLFPPETRSPSPHQEKGEIIKNMGDMKMINFLWCSTSGQEENRQAAGTSHVTDL